MATLRRQRDSCEIRECRVTERGPRQFTLARFRGALTLDVLDEAAARAKRPFDVDAVVARARAAGIPVALRRGRRAAHALLAALRSGSELDAGLVHLLREALAARPATALPNHLEDAAEWVGRGEATRGRALRGLLRTASRILASRGDATRVLPEEPFPRFHTRPLEDEAPA